MNDAVRMGRGERPRELHRDADDLGQRERSVLQERAQRRSWHVLAGQIQLAVDFFQRVDGRDPGMRQGGGGAGFLPDARPPLRVGAGARRDRLQRHAA